MIAVPPNPILKQLGLAEFDRALILHADDVGMCEATLSAFAELTPLGVSGSVMVPSPWFPAVADYHRNTKNSDLGLHLTLTSEWSHYRWRPISGGVDQASLLDEHGYLPRSMAELWAKAVPDAIFREVTAQIDQAARAGISPTHFDDHMAALQRPDLLWRYVDLVSACHLPFRQARPNVAQPGESDWQRQTRAALIEAEARGLPLFDRIVGLPLDEADATTKIAFIRHFLSELPPGTVSLLFGHPASDTPELRQIAPDWHGRVADLTTLADPQIYRFMRQSGIHLLRFDKLPRPL